MRKKIVTVLFLPLLIFCIAAMAGCPHSVVTPGSHNNRNTAPPGQHEAKIYCNATIEDDFDGSTVLVVMDKHAGGINKKHEDGFFGNFEKVYVKDITAIEGDVKNTLIVEDRFRQILEIKLPFDSKENVLSVIRELEQIEGILYAGPNCHYYPCNEPNDYYYEEGDQWGLNGTYGIGAPTAWYNTVGSHDVKVGIIDTGIASFQMDLYNPSGYGNRVAGWNCVDENHYADDADGHGTAMAGVCGAMGNNTIGVTGVNWNVSLVPLKIDYPYIDPSYPGIYTPTSDSGKVIRAITFAIQNNISILNLSWGGSALSSFNDIALQNAISSFYGLFICAAGNGKSGIGFNTDLTPNYPSCFPLDNIISVGAIGSNGNRTSFSNYGIQTVDLFHPARKF